MVGFNKLDKGHPQSYFARYKLVKHEKIVIKSTVIV